jgi:superfamily I DNA and/or RNA helicase
MYYEGLLKTAETVLTRKNDNFGFPPFSFVDIDGNERRNSSYHGSYENEAEARAIVSILSTKFRRSQKVLILTFYSAQQGLIASLLREHNRPMTTVTTVDSSQGKEAEIVILSMVRSSRNCGFLKDPRRLNVALTRAKKCLIVFGKWKSLSESDSKDLKDLMQNVRNRKLVLRPTIPTTKFNHPRAKSAKNNSSTTFIKENESLHVQQTRNRNRKRKIRKRYGGRKQVHSDKNSKSVGKRE